jgi:hypothetical protein
MPFVVRQLVAVQTAISVSMKTMRDSILSSEESEHHFELLTLHFYTCNSPFP